MLECCILFVHHRDDEVTRRHLRSLRDLNPYPVVAACNAAEECVEGALDVAKLSDEGASEPKWEGPDTILYRWFRHGGLRARRYVVLEWDNHATTPVDDFYSEVWDVDAAAANVMRIENEADRHWFGHIDSLPAELRGKACGVVPFNGVLLSHRALEAVASGPFPPRVFCELRLGTLLRSAGFEPTAFPREKEKMNSFDRRFIEYTPDRPGIYHPIKAIEEDR